MARQKLKVTNRQGLSLSLRKSIALLQLNQVELRELVLKELSENPFLESTEADLESFESFLPADDSEGNTGKSEFIEEATVSLSSVIDNLFSQLKIMSVPKEILPLAQAIVSSIDSSGFSSDLHANFAEKMGFKSRALKQVQSYLKKLDPPGIASESRWQSLLWQLEISDADPILIDIVEILSANAQSLSSLEEEEIKTLSYMLQLTEKELRNKLDIISKINIYPLSSIKEARKEKVIPEVSYIKQGSEIQVIIRSQIIPELSLNTELFRELNESVPDASSKKWYVKYNEAKNLVKGVNYRRDSLARVAEAVLLKQAFFFERGPSALRPLRLQDIAREVGLHISTVSRIVSEKYCDTPWGVFSFRYFFPGGIPHEKGMVILKEFEVEMRKVLAVEDPKHPLSDEKIMQNLKKRGFLLERRTVAKYRKLLHIPSAKQRKAI